MSDSMKARWMMELLTKNRGEILTLQRSIRAAMSRLATKEAVAECDSESVIEPHALSVLSPTEVEVERVKERMFITQSTVNRCLEVEYSIHPRLLQYFVSVGEKSLVKKLKEMEPSKVWERIDRDGLYGYYVCEEDEVYAVV